MANEQIGIQLTIVLLARFIYLSLRLLVSRTFSVGVDVVVAGFCGVVGIGCMGVLGMGEIGGFFAGKEESYGGAGGQGLGG